jgi:hypothetical protein
MQHPLNILPASMHMDGQDWVPASWAFALADALREKQRTTQSHNHQFAAINDCFDNLPISHAGAPYAASAEAFRKHGLIVTGHCDVETVDVLDHEAAKAIAPMVSKNAKAAHGYALTIVRGPLVICSTPHSQSFKAMGKEQFNKSKADVLDWAERLLGVRA